MSVGVEGGGAQSQTLYPLVAVSVGVEGGGTVSDPVSSGSSVCRCRGGGGSQSQTLYPLVAVSVGVEGGGHSLRPCILW